MKKCKVCNKPAVYHLTEIQNGQAQALHFCEKHFQDYISGQAPQEEWESPDESSLIELNSQDLELDEELECPNCGITFQEFRSEGRLGCPHDYIAFREPLVQLLENIHGECEHIGKFPKRAPTSSQQQYNLIKLRRELTAAVAEENYETAASLRDQISKLEEEEQNKLDSDSSEEE